MSEYSNQHLINRERPSSRDHSLGIFLFFEVPFSGFGFSVVTAGRCNNLGMSNLKCVAEIIYSDLIIALI
jgi:hypothetical protein